MAKDTICLQWVWPLTIFSRDSRQGERDRERDREREITCTWTADQPPDRQTEHNNISHCSDHREAHWHTSWCPRLNEPQSLTCVAGVGEPEGEGTAGSKVRPVTDSAVDVTAAKPVASEGKSIVLEGVVYINSVNMCVTCATCERVTYTHKHTLHPTLSLIHTSHTWSHTCTPQRHRQTHLTLVNTHWRTHSMIRCWISQSREHTSHNTHTHTHTHTHTQKLGVCVRCGTSRWK